MFTPLTYDSLGTSLAPPQPARPEIDQQALDDRGMLLPHVRTFQSLYNLFSKTYSYRWDEAVRHGLEDARAMRNDTYFRALLQERLSPLGLWDWTVEPDPDPLNPKAPHSADRAKVAAMLRAEAAACPGLMKFRRHLGWCTWFGRVANQVVTAPSRDLPWGPHTVRQWEPVDGDKLHYSWSDTGADGHWCVLVNPGAAAQYPGETTVSDRSTLLRLRRPDYRRRFVVATHEIEDAPYEDYLAAGRSKGVGLRDFVFWGWWLRDEMLSWMISLAEKAGSLGIMLFGYPVDSAAGKAQAVQNAKDVNSRNALAVPMGPQQRIDDWVKVVAMPTEGLRFLKEVTFDYFDKHFERLFVGQTLSSGTEGGGLGGTGVADMHEDTKFTLLKFDALNQAECLTEDYVRVLQGLNHPDDRWKYRWVYQLPDPKSKDKLEAITKAASLPGPKLTYRADDVRKLVGMAKPDAGDEVVGGDDPADPGAAGNEGDPSSGPGGQPDPKAGGGEGEEPAPGMDVLVAAMVQAAADGDRQAVDSLAEIGQDPDGLAVLLDDLEAGETPDVPEERDGQPPLTYQGGALYAYAWSRATTKSGGVKAVGTGEHQGKTLYGKRAEAALRGRKKGAGEPDKPGTGTAGRTGAADDPATRRKPADPELVKKLLAHVGAGPKPPAAGGDHPRADMGKADSPARAFAAKASEQYRRAEDEYSRTGAEIAHLKARIRDRTIDLNTGLRDLMTATQARDEARAKLGREARLDLRAFHMLGGGNRVNIDTSSGTAWTQEEHKRMEESSDFVADLLSKSHGEVPGVRMDRSGKEGGGRAYYDSTFKRVHVTRRDDAGTYVHELGHHLEEHVPGAKEKVRAFLAARVGAETPVSLKKLYPNSGFSADEVGRADDFAKLFPDDPAAAHYVGKVYPGDRYTEVLSMGLELLYRNPKHFARTDPEYFDLMIGILQPKTGGPAGGQTATA